MTEHSRYNTSHDQAGFEAGILKNKLGIRDQKKLNRAETVLLRDAYQHFSEKSLKFDLQLIFEIHEYFLSPLYSWAGKIRSVDISKDGMLFCSAMHLEENLKQFAKILSQNLPRKNDSKKLIARKLALIHNEFNALHPFREGNGRTIRLFIDLMIINLGYQRMNYKKAGHKAYLRACQAGMEADHKPMEQLFFKGLVRK